MRTMRTTLSVQVFTLTHAQETESACGRKGVGVVNRTEQGRDA